MQATIVIMRCVNVQCRVETFKGAIIFPLQACPVCLNPGAQLLERN